MKQPTSERLILEDYQSDVESVLISVIHTATYRFCQSYSQGKRVLDFGCGSGYGTAMLSESCASAVGVDISEEAVTYAREHYMASNLKYLVINRAEESSLPFAPESFDVVTSLQVIEHVQNTQAYLREISRVLKPGGTVIVATPDRRDRLFSWQKPWNMWHIREYSRDQLRATMEQHFVCEEILHIGGVPDVARIELRRTRRLRWLLLPLTLPLVPESVRIKGLSILKRVLASRSAGRATNAAFRPAFDESAVSISHSGAQSLDLIAVAVKR